MLTVRASAESGGQSVRTVGLQFVYVCAVEGEMRHAAEASAARARIVERMLIVLWMTDRGQQRLLRGVCGTCVSRN